MPLSFVLPRGSEIVLLGRDGAPSPSDLCGPPLSETAPVNPVIDSLRSPFGLPLAVFLCYASIPVLLSKKRFSGYPPIAQIFTNRERLRRRIFVFGFIRVHS